MPDWKHDRIGSLPLTRPSAVLLTVVYRVTDTKLGRDVVLKVLNPQRTVRTDPRFVILNERAALRKCGPPCIPPNYTLTTCRADYFKRVIVLESAFPSARRRMKYTPLEAVFPLESLPSQTTSFRPAGRTSSTRVATSLPVTS